MQLPVPGRLALHAAPAASPDLAFTALLALAGLGSAVVLGLALAALVRRRSRSYLLVTLALATLLARTGVAALSLAGSMDATLHHWLEHALDAAMAALVVAAVYDARSVRRSSGEDRDRSVRSDGGPDAGERGDDPRSTDERRDEP